MKAHKARFGSATVEWATPKHLYAKLNAEFHFDFDPCPLGGTQDELAELFTSWRGKRVYCNPPYGPPIGKFIKRGFEADLAVFLVPSRTDTRWFHELVLPYAEEVRFVRGRLKFGDAKHPAPFPSMILVFRKDVA